MATRTGLFAVVDAVRAYFTAEAITAVVHVGWKQRNKLINEGPGGANRVVFIPSDPKGNAGDVSMAASKVGTNPESIARWDWRFMLSIWAADASSQANLADDEKQIEAVVTLFEQTLRGCRYGANANVQIAGGVAFTLEPLEHAFGRELLVPMVLRTALFDQTYTTATPAAGLTKNLVVGIEPDP